MFYDAGMIHVAQDVEPPPPLLVRLMRQYSVFITQYSGGFTSRCLFTAFESTCPDLSDPLCQPSAPLFAAALYRLANTAGEC